jgi:hypothetical protein
MSATSAFSTRSARFTSARNNASVVDQPRRKRIRGYVLTPEASWCR